MSHTVIQLLIIITWIILISIIIIYSFRHFKIIKKTITFSIRNLFKDFKQKMWMTVGIGIVFASLFLAVVLGGTYFINSNTRTQIFTLLYKHPRDFIYIGLLLFAVVTLGIYVVRRVIIYLYTLYHK